MVIPVFDIKSQQISNLIIDGRINIRPNLVYAVPDRSFRMFIDIYVDLVYLVIRSVKQIAVLIAGAVITEAEWLEAAGA